MIDTTKEYIVCAANWYDDGTKHGNQPKNITIGFVLSGLYHSSCIASFAVPYKYPYDEEAIKVMRTCKDGFLTSYNRFVDRVEAGQIAIACGQIKKMHYFNDTKLDSSDLYGNFEDTK